MCDYGNVQPKLLGHGELRHIGSVRDSYRNATDALNKGIEYGQNQSIPQKSGYIYIRMPQRANGLPMPRFLKGGL
jgi:hypothetical protein